MAEHGRADDVQGACCLGGVAIRQRENAVGLFGQLDAMGVTFLAERGEGEAATAAVQER